MAKSFIISSKLMCKLLKKKDCKRGLACLKQKCKSKPHNATKALGKGAIGQGDVPFCQVQWIE